MDDESRERAVRAAVRNNAEWCDAVCRAHAVPGEFGGEAWTSARRTPPLYPDAVTLTPDASPGDLVSRIDTGSPGCSVKDSFARLDLAPLGFWVLFEAQWIHRPADKAGAVGKAGMSPSQYVSWGPLADADALPAWETAWADGEEGGGLFRAELLSDDTMFLAGASAAGEIVAGAVVSRSESVVGVSNLFARGDAPGGEESAWAGCLAEVARLWPGLPVVGYESGESLDAAVRAGFTPIGPLRVWLRSD
ncbi:hypothetical protein [Streptomyces sp. MZ04]|uniref:hypothetical protein n=1 Tax=Streptomyces sp. MZ04 TaxID=2559236 RepID=UPI00107E7302|nr:hypothetical protein [Streptomyces sp. MZ04]TGB06280.1 hypothetical protein E2651_23705 [Streptomyces sp. MZ04]